MKTFITENIPFAPLHKSEFNNWTRAKRNEGFNFIPVETVYVSLSDLKEIAEQLKRNSNDITGMVWTGIPAFMSPAWINEYSPTKEKSYQFATGHYRRLWDIFLVDDIFEWVHFRIKEDKIRSAADIVWRMAGNRSKTPIYFYPTTPM